MILRVIAEETSDGQGVGEMWKLNFNGRGLDSIHKDQEGFIEEDNWKFSIDSTGYIEFGSPAYLVKGKLLDNKGVGNGS